MSSPGPYSVRVFCLFWCTWPLLLLIFCSSATTKELFREPRRDATGFAPPFIKRNLICTYRVRRELLFKRSCRSIMSTVGLIVACFLIGVYLLSN